MASATVGILRVLFTANTAEFEAGMKRVASGAQTFTRNLQSVGQQASSVGAALTRTLTLPIAGVAAAAVKAGAQFETVMNSIQGVLTPTAAEMEKVRETAIQMGAETAFSASDAATAMLELGKAGFTTAQSIAAVPQVLELAAASGLSMAEAAELAARSLNAFGLETSDLSHVNDVLAKAVNSSTLEITDLQTAFKYIGPIAQGFGLSIEEVSAALAIMRDNGIAAETSGRALREGMSRLANPVKAVHEVLGELNIDLREVDPSLHSMSEIVGVLQSKGITAAQSLRMFGDAAGPGMFALVSQGRSALEGLTTQFENSEGAAKKMADAMMQGLPGALERLRGSVETAMLSISRAIEPAILAILSVGERLADLVTNTIVPAFMALPQWVQTSAIGLTALAAAAGPVIFVLGQMITAVSTVTALFTTKGLVMRGLIPIINFYTTSMTAAAGATTVLKTSLGALVGITTAVAAAFGTIAFEWAKFKGDRVRAFDVLIPPLGLIRTGLDQLGESAKKTLAPMKPMASHATDAAGGLKMMASHGDAAARSLPKVATAAKDTSEAIKDVGRATREFYNFAGERRMEDEAALLVSLQRQRDAWNEQFRFLAQLRQGSVLLLQSTLDLTKMFEPLKTAPLRNMPTVSQWTDAWGQMKVGLTNALSNIPQIFVQAFTGGGGVMGALKAIGVQLAEALVTPLIARVKEMLAQQLSDAISSGVSGAAGAGGGGLSAGLLGLGAFGGVAMIAFALESARAKAQQMREALDKARVEIGRLRHEVGEAARAFPALNAEFERLFNQKPTEDSIRRMGEILGEIQQKVADTNSEFGDLAQRLLDAGGRLPEALRPVIAQLVQLGVLSKENVALFQQLTGVTHVDVDWKKMQEAGQRYGDWMSTELGATFNQLKNNDFAKQIINDFDLLTRGGASVGSVLFGMKEEIVKLIQDSIKFGTTIPENMRPWIEELERAGLLIDENGEYLFDLGALKFGQPIKTEVELITEAFEKFIAQLDIVAQRLATLPQPNVNVPGVPGSPSPGPTQSQDEPNPVPMARGGLVMQRTFAMLGEAGPELVIPLRELSRIKLPSPGMIPLPDFRLTKPGEPIGRIDDPRESFKEVVDAIHEMREDMTRTFEEMRSTLVIGLRDAMLGAV